MTNVLTRALILTAFLFGLTTAAEAVRVRPWAVTYRAYSRTTRARMRRYRRRRTRRRSSGRVTVVASPNYAGNVTYRVVGGR
jgi:hypothetical protein